MAILQLPALGTSAKQLRRAINILESCVETHKKGLQVLIPISVVEDPFEKEKFIDIVKKNVPKEYVVVYHAPYSAHGDDSRLNLFYETSIPTYVKIAEMLSELNGEVLVMHINTVYGPNEWKPPLSDYKYVSETVWGKVRENILTLAKQTNIKLAFENMALPLRGNTTSDTSQIPFEPFLHTVEQIQDFLNSVEDANNVCFSIDLTHYGLCRNKINYLLDKYGHPTSEDINSEGLKGIYPEIVKYQPSLKDAFDSIQKSSHGRITHIQAADFEGEWFANETSSRGKIYEEGTIIGKGKMGGELVDFISYISETYPHIGISFDVEVDDFLDRREQIESLETVLRKINP